MSEKISKLGRLNKFSTTQQRNKHGGGGGGRTPKRWQMPKSTRSQLPNESDAQAACLPASLPGDLTSQIHEETVFQAREMKEVLTSALQ